MLKIEITEWLAIIISVISAIFTIKSNRKTNEFEEYKERIRQIERNEDLFLTKEELSLAKNDSKINLMPYFHLELNQKINLINIGSELVLEFPISLINIGKETATNVSLQSWSDNYHNTNYFKIAGYNVKRHVIRSYFDRQFALAGQSVNFSVACDMHEDAYNVWFKIHYNDLIGRCYEQEFRFQYCYKISNDFSMNHTTKPPKCIEENI